MTVCKPCTIGDSSCPLTPRSIAGTRRTTMAVDFGIGKFG